MLTMAMGALRECIWYKAGRLPCPGSFRGLRDLFEVSGYCGEEFSFGIGGSIAFFSDGKAGHLERRILKSPGDVRILLRFTVQDQRLHDAAYDGLFHGVVGL